MVRLLPKMFGKVRCRCGVSIPQWCDCCDEIPVGTLIHGEVSIPQWCDCCTDVISAISPRPECFNPTMVRLLQFPATTQVVSKSGFNPTMVRLLPSIATHCRVLHRSFNPTMVRLLHSPYHPHLPPKLRFNPTMVRLLP